MVNVPKRVGDRFGSQLATFQKVLRGARDRDVNEADTITIIKDLLASVFGFDKYTEVTSEQAIRGTYCDLAVKLDGKIKYLIEVKAVGLTLKENHLRQAVGYAANQGIPWVVLTNGVVWEIYRIRFEQPISHELVCSLDLLELNPRKKDDHERLYLLCREGLSKAAIEEFHDYVQVVNRFVVGAIIGSDPVLAVVRRELRRLAPEAKVSVDDLRALLPDVVKRDILEGDAAVQAKRRVARSASKPLRQGRKRPAESSQAGEGEASAVPPLEHGAE